MKKHKLSGNGGKGSADRTTDGDAYRSNPVWETWEKEKAARKAEEQKKDKEKLSKKKKD